MSFFMGDSCTPCSHIIIAGENLQKMLEAATW